MNQRSALAVSMYPVALRTYECGLAGEVRRRIDQDLQRDRRAAFVARLQCHHGVPASRPRCPPPRSRGPDRCAGAPPRRCTTSSRPMRRGRRRETDLRARAGNRPRRRRCSSRARVAGTACRIPRGCRPPIHHRGSTAAAAARRRRRTARRPAPGWRRRGRGLSISSASATAGRSPCSFIRCSVYTTRSSAGERPVGRSPAISIARAACGARLMGGSSSHEYIRSF